MMCDFKQQCCIQHFNVLLMRVSIFNAIEMKSNNTSPEMRNQIKFKLEYLQIINDLHLL